MNGTQLRRAEEHRNLDALGRDWVHPNRAVMKEESERNYETLFRRHRLSITTGGAT